MAVRSFWQRKKQKAPNGVAPLPPPDLELLQAESPRAATKILLRRQRGKVVAVACITTFTGSLGIADPVLVHHLADVMSAGGSFVSTAEAASFLSGARIAWSTVNSMANAITRRVGLTINRALYPDWMRKKARSVTIQKTADAKEVAVVSDPDNDFGHVSDLLSTTMTVGTQSVLTIGSLSGSLVLAPTYAWPYIGAVVGAGLCARLGIQHIAPLAKAVSEARQEWRRRMGKFDRAREMLVTTRGADEYEIARMMPLYEEVTEKDTRFKLYGKIIGEFPFLLVSGVAYPVSVVLASTAGGSAAQNLVEVMAAGVMGTYAGNAVGRAVDAGSKLPEQWQAFGRLTEQIRTRDATDDIDGARDIELDDSKPLISIERPVVSLAAKSTPVVDMHENEPIELRAGERIYIAGASGSGKSTLAKAIVRRLTLDDGCVRVSGVPVREATRSSLTQIMGFVPQAPEVFQGTLRQNIAFGLGDKSLSESEVQQWFRDLGFEKDGLDLDQQALNADHSPALSGGQVQRLALGRVLARRPKVLVLDEPTSALDRRSQAVVGSLIDRFQRKGGAVLEITHNVASVGTRWSRGNDDLVVVMDNGSVVEKGTHGDLMQNPDGAYRALHNADKHFSSAAKEFSPRIWAKGFMEMREGDHQRLTTGMSLEETLGYNAQWSDHVVDAFAAAGVTTDVSNAKFCRLIGREIDRMYSSSHTTPEECAVELAARVKNALIETGRVCDGQVALFEI